MPDGSEIFSLQQMVEAFDIDRMTTGGPTFDQTLSWLNGQYLRELSPQAYAQRVQDWMFNRDTLEQLIPLVQERAERFSDLVPLVITCWAMCPHPARRILSINLSSAAMF